MRHLLAITLIGSVVGLHVLYAIQEGVWADIASAALFCAGLLVAYGRIRLDNLPENETCPKYVAPAKVGMAIVVIDAIAALLLVNLVESVHSTIVFLVFIFIALVGLFLIGRYVAYLSRESRSLL
jgi:hypothetical protein